LFDKRFGKRILELFSISNDTHPIIIQFYQIRCEAEGILPNWGSTSVAVIKGKVDVIKWEIYY
jgi:hypothetical protein